MSEAARPPHARRIVTAESRPYLARHVMLRHDPVRERWVMLAPERVLVPEPTAVAVLQLADGRRSAAEIAEALAQTYQAPAELILADALEMFQDLADRGFLRLKEEAPDGRPSAG